MKSGMRIGLAVGFGYLLGRRRKLRTALTLGAAVAAGRASRDPGQLLRRGTDLLNSSPQLANLSKLGGPLASAGRSAVSAAAGSGVDALSGRLRGTADSLRRRSGGGDQGPGDPRSSAPDEEPELDDQAYDYDDDREPGRDERPAPARRRR
ncbi:hypothetical protein ACFY3U_15190 [Micromonospora sp. NPDC000089]|uniref:hypothetical protein n=1 Tax=unclassified Micromonospora TaxID=2617518 RepID=UPI0036AB3962